jgi:hypothetical protein
MKGKIFLFILLLCEGAMAQDSLYIHRKGDTLICVERGTIFSFRHKSTNKIKELLIPLGREVVYLGDSSNYLKVEYNDYIGYTDTLGCITKKYGLLFANHIRELMRQDSIEKVNEKRANEKAEANEDIKHKNSLIKKYGQTNGSLVYQKKIRLGMSKEMVIESWGQPKDIHRTVGSWGVHEQWIYGETYLYFENGILTSWQD